jgi:uncharacterized protein (DUF2141 family)
MKRLGNPGKEFTFLWALLLPGAAELRADIPVVIEIQDVRVQGGTLYVAVYSDEASYKNNEPCGAFKRDPTGSALSIELNLPAGDYVATAFQDTKGNGR